MSSLNSEFMDEKMIEVFFQDTDEMLEATADDVLDIENGYNREVLDNIMRTMHSIKGGSAMLEMVEVERFSHKLEDGFIKLRDKIVPITPEIVDDMIGGINCLKKWISKREKIFKEKKIGFSDAIADEKKEFDIFINRIEKNMGVGSQESDKTIKKENTKESAKVVQKQKEEDVYRFEIYFDETAPMFEVKRTIIQRNLQELGEIKDSDPSPDNIMDNSSNYYKVVIKSKKSIEEIVKAMDVSDIIFIAATPGENELNPEFIEKEVYMKKNCVKENIHNIYENILLIVSDGKITKLYTEGKKIDIYGIQVLEALKRENNSEIL